MVAEIWDTEGGWRCGATGATWGCWEVVQKFGLFFFYFSESRVKVGSWKFGLLGRDLGYRGLLVLVAGKEAGISRESV